LLSAVDYEPAERARAIRHRAFVEFVPPLMAVVERCRLADTLLYGKCAPHEVEWSRQLWLASGGFAASAYASVAQLVGYETYLMVAGLGLAWLYDAYKPMAARVAPPTAAQTQQIISCVETALGYMRRRRPDVHHSFGYEGELLNQVRGLVLHPLGYISDMHHDALSAALGRLEANSKDIAEFEDMLQLARRGDQRSKARAQADKAAHGLQSCAHCSAQEVHVDQFKRCAACKGPRFCSKDCQRADWPAHKAACKAARKAAAAASAGA
jgi:hypothetical protein